MNKGDILDLELKLSRGEYTLENGLEQLSRYLRKLGHGCLIIYDKRYLS